MFVSVFVFVFGPYNVKRLGTPWSRREGARRLPAHVGDDGSAEVRARLELVEDGRELRQRTGPGHMALHATGTGEVDDLPHSVAVSR